MTDSIAAAPLPTQATQATLATLDRRANLPYQLFRSIAINLKMTRVILRGHG